MTETTAHPYSNQASRVSRPPWHNAPIFQNLNSVVERNGYLTLKTKAIRKWKWKLKRTISIKKQKASTQAVTDKFPRTSRTNRTTKLRDNPPQLTETNKELQRTAVQLNMTRKPELYHVDRNAALIARITAQTIT